MPNSSSGTSSDHVDSRSYGYSELLDVPMIEFSWMFYNAVQVSEME